MLLLLLLLLLIGALMAVWCGCCIMLNHDDRACQQGLWAPGRRLRFVQAGKVLSNMLKAHVAVYHQLKAMPAGPSAQVSSR